MGPERQRQSWIRKRRRPSHRPLVVIAVGGNSLITDQKHQTVLDQYIAAGETAHHIAPIAAGGRRVVITHGNGPQVGFMLLRSEMAKDVLHEVPLENCVADTQGAIGYQISQTLRNELHRLALDQQVASVVTQVVVDPDDPGFEHPSKPIGPFMDEADATHHAANDGWAVAEDAGRGWRRLVPSPMPLEIIELETIRTLLNAGILVVAVGGGGIPVIRRADGSLRGCDAVIDKDMASGLLARQLGASVLIFSTSVDKVALNFNTPDQLEIEHMTARECRRYLEDGHFKPGSMRPKIEAALAFLEAGGVRVIITQPHHLDRSLRGIYGTHIMP
jgi:carbamate kinase